MEEIDAINGLALVTPATSLEAVVAKARIVRHNLWDHGDTENGQVLSATDTLVLAMVNELIALAGKEA